ncbi:MAG: hypothetical protein ACRDV9_02915 [Acidimicrobiia bacterium]
MRPAIFFLVAVGLVSTFASCTGSSPPTEQADTVAIGEGETVSTTRLVAVARSICEAVAAAPLDPLRARTKFERAHSELHLLARAITRVDRRTASRLLVAKRAVEEDLEAQGAMPRLASDLLSLGQATVVSLDRLGATASECSAPT